MLLFTSILEKATVSVNASVSYCWPVNINYSITCGMYYSSGSLHGATDFGVGVGTPVYATASGTVITASDNGCRGSHNSGQTPSCSLGSNCGAVKSTGKSHGSYGNWIVIDHGNNVYSWYCHLQTGSFKVAAGSTVKQGQQIACSGAAGNTYGAHLHFEMRVGSNSYNNRVDPQKYLTKVNVDPEDVDNDLLNPVVYNDAWYAAYNSPVSSMTPVERQQHWLNYGSKWGWQASPAFFAHEYRLLYPDLAAAFGTDDFTPVIEHFLNHGIGEWRSGRAMFSPELYKANYSDLQNAYGDNNYSYYLHFVQAGYNEGRVADHRLQVYFDTSNGGSSSEKQRDWTAGTPIGTLPTLTRSGYTGAWYTEKTGGTRVTADYIYPGTEDFTVYAQWTKSGQEMTSGAARSIPDGDYMIVTAGVVDKSKFYFMDIAGSDLPAADRTDVVICGPTAGELNSHDIWTVTYGSDGFYTIKQKGADVSLDLLDANVTEGANIGAHKANGTNAQKWMITHNGRNGYRILAKASGFAVDISGGSVASGASIIQKSLGSSDTQSWLFIPYRPKQELADGRYILLSEVDNSLELDVPGDTAEVPDSTGVQIWSDTAPSRYNSFNVKKLDNGYYSIIHNASGKAVEVYGGVSDLKKQASLYTANGSNAQQWAVTKAGTDGSYILRVKTSGYALDLLDSARANGSPVGQNQYSGSSSMKWKFVKAEYIIRYDANGGTKAPGEQVKYYNTDLILQNSVPERTGYRFLGWSDGNASARTAGYTAGGQYRQNKDTTLYAVWEKPEPDLILPSSLKTVGEEAFEGGTFKYVKLPEGTTAIERRAFAGCTYLKDIYIPEAVISIAADAFEGTSGLTIRGKTGSYVEYYAEKYGYVFLAE